MRQLAEMADAGCNDIKVVPFSRYYGQISRQSGASISDMNTTGSHSPLVSGGRKLVRNYSRLMAANQSSDDIDELTIELVAAAVRDPAAAVKAASDFALETTLGITTSLAANGLRYELTFDTTGNNPTPVGDASSTITRRTFFTSGDGASTVTHY
jgi:hypothetical protein